MVFGTLKVGPRASRDEPRSPDAALEPAVPQVAAVAGLRTQRVRIPDLDLDYEKHIKQQPFELFFEVWGHYLTYSWAPGIAASLNWGSFFAVVPLLLKSY